MTDTAGDPGVISRRLANGAVVSKALLAEVERRLNAGEFPATRRPEVEAIVARRRRELGLPAGPDQGSVS